MGQCVRSAPLRARGGAAGAVGSPLQEVPDDSGAVGGCTAALQEIP